MTRMGRCCAWFATTASLALLPVCALGAEASVIADARGFPAAVTGPDGATSRFTYDAAGRIAEMTDPLGRRVRIAYDGSSERPLTITGPGANGPVKRFSYDAAGRPLRI